MKRNVLSFRIVSFVAGIILCLSALLMLSGCETGGSPWTGMEQNAPATTKPGVTPPPVAGTTPPAKLTPGAPNKVALLVPLTGKGSDAGQAMLNAAQLAMFDLGANSFELVPIDTGASASAAATQAVQSGAKIILGPLFATDAKSAAPVAQAANINLISFSTDATAAGPNTFILGFLPRSQISRVVDYAFTQGKRRIGLIAPRDAFGDASALSFTRALKIRGLNETGIMRYAGDTPSVEEFAAFTAGGPMDAVLIAANAAQADIISKQLPANVQRMGTGLWDQVDGTRYPSLVGAWFAASPQNLRARFEKKYAENYGAQPPRLASLAYDASALAIILSKQGAGFSRAALLNPNGFSGVDGIFRFTGDGLNERGLAVHRISNGAPSVIENAPSSFR